MSAQNEGSQFGKLAKLEFLQTYASAFIAWINPAIVHNMEKYVALKKVHYLSAIEHIKGDYLEFGVFTGSSFCHSIRCAKQLFNLNQAILDTHFYGFDSFSGFGKVEPDDAHPFYTDANFATDFQHVQKRIARASKGKVKFTLIPGYFEESLLQGPETYGISKARIIFIDSDTYSSANAALRFCASLIQEGTFIVVDDFFSYKGSIEKGVARAYSEFLEINQFSSRQLFTYGMGGCAFVLSSTTVAS